ncbi:peptidoglycan editing factor PgeF [Pseudothauera hydrothermalis]|uniref:peptidoglycan editing factor PgeF n=1 Tax=Pseudothauera hydrothermalis TaxID=2184083 RepID=UPI000E08DC89|nr:peptidoglycan editing factor PgeF [Pseudothauera hydrothermalis]
MSLDFIVPQWPAPARVRAIVTTRNGGLSQGRYASLNLATHVGDDPGAVAANRAVLRSRLPAEPVWLEQVHGTNIVMAESVPGERCLPPVADGAWTRQPGVVCAVMTADCLPVLFCDDAGSVVAAAHAGWRGLCAGILERTVEAMRVAPARIQAWLGPAIGPGAFEVGADVRSAFLQHDSGAAAAFVAGKEPGKWLADLYLLAKIRLAGAGVIDVFGGGFCTYTDAERFYSHRRDRATGRMASLIWLAH